MTAIYTDWAAYPWWYSLAAPMIYIGRTTLVLLDAPVAAPPAGVPPRAAVHHASRPPTRVGGDELPPDRGTERGLVIPALVFAVRFHPA